MKKVFIISCMLLLAYITFGQQIRSRDVDIDDIMNLLRASGYELFSFDITEMLNARYNLHFIKKEFEAGEKIGSSNLTVTPNKRLLTDFPGTTLQDILDAGRSIIDPETQAIAHAEKFNIGFYPSSNDSIKMMQISVPDFVTSRRPLRLRGLTIEDSDRPFYRYRVIPFRIEAFEANTFIPLILVGSAWIDERFNMIRFCSEREFSPDMSNESLQNIPHYFVIGVRFDRQN